MAVADGNTAVRAGGLEFGYLQAGEPGAPLALCLHGSADRCLGAEVVAGAAQFLPPGSRQQLIDGAGHFLQLDRPAEIGASITGWLAG